MRGIVRIVANAYMNGKAYAQQVTTQTRGGPLAPDRFDPEIKKRFGDHASRALVACCAVFRRLSCGPRCPREDMAPRETFGSTSPPSKPARAKTARCDE